MNETSKMTFLQLARRPAIIKRSLIIAAIVGTILNLINQGDVINDMAQFDLWKCLLTYIVPYCVSTYGAVSALLDNQKN